jgi:hypothetical protein
MACSEVEDEIPPLISFLSPTENTSVAMPDTLKVVAYISDNMNIESVMVVLADVEGNPVIPAEYRFPETTEYTLTAYRPLVDKTLTGGSYRVKITANDGTNTNTEYLPVLVNEIPRELLGFLAITAEYPFETNIRCLKPDFSPDTSFVFPKGFLRSAYSSLWDEFIFVSPEPSVMYSLSRDRFEPMWDFSASLPRPQFTSLWVDSQLLFATANGDAGILNASGMIVMRTGALSNKTIACMAADGKYIYAELMSLSGNNREIVAFYRATGGIRSRKFIDQDIISLQIANGKVLMFSNSGMQGIISEFDPETTLISTLETFNNPEIYSSIKLSNDEFLLLCQGQVLHFNSHYGTLSEWISGTYLSGCLDDLQERLFMISGTQVDIYAGPSPSLVQTLQFEAPLEAFHIIYNK